MRLEMSDNTWAWQEHILDRLVVRRGEHVMTDDFGLVDVESIAVAMNNHCDRAILQNITKDQFAAACAGTVRKSRRIHTEYRRPDFLPEQMASYLLGVDMMDGSIRILDGVRRAEALFDLRPDLPVTVQLAPCDLVRRFATKPDPESARHKLWVTMQERLLWISAGNEAKDDDQSDDAGGDPLAFTVAGGAGRPKASPVEEYLEACSKVCGYELIVRAKKEKSKEFGKDTDYNKYLSERAVEIGGRRYQAFHSLTADNGDSIPRKTGGRYATWKRWLKTPSKAHERYFAELGIWPYPRFPIDPQSMSQDELEKAFVVATRARAASIRNRKANRYLARQERNRDGIPNADELEREMLGTKKEQNEMWLGWPAQKEAAVLLGINVAEFIPNMTFAYDILQWWTQTFFIARGMWKPILWQSEAEQFLMWLAIEQSPSIPVEVGEHGTGFQLEWKSIFLKLTSLPPLGRGKDLSWPNALEHAFYNCIASLQRESKIRMPGLSLLT
jgi:hypothetical protein